MKKETIAVTCTGMDAEGKGLVKLQGKELHVPGLIEGEKAEIELKRIKGYTSPVVVNIQEKSQYRAEPDCPCYYKCGGCQLQHLSNEGQAWFKQKAVERLLGKYGRVNNIITMKEPYNYRNKVHSTLSSDSKKGIVSGIYEEYTHNVIPIDRCMIQDDRADAIISTIKDIMRKLKIRPYDEDKEQGFMRHILIKTGFATGQVMVVLVTASQMFPGRSSFMSLLLKAHPEITTVVMNVNSRKTSVVLGNQEKVLYGKGYIEDVLCGCTFQISPKSFYQINPQQTEVLYTKAIEMAGFRGTETVLDAYCGTGTIGLIASSKVKSVYGVELNKDAVRDAIKNAKRNNITNAYFYNEDAGRFMENLSRQNQRVDAVFMDPPRSGSDERFLSSLVKLKPGKVVYISCNPLTLERDLSYITRNGYRVGEIQPVDMFPQTAHVETVVLITRAKK
jgi:23S rRNA (uracil1939-C5)-methyltransferase